MMTVDRRAPVPLYHQLKRALVDQIRRERLAPGARLPTEAEIEQRYRVSRTTIRQALQELVTEGVVERVQGKGTFVAVGSLSHFPVLNSFTENMRTQGHRPSRRLLESRLVDAPRAIAEALELDDPRCRYLRRLLLADDRPLGVAETWLPHSQLGDNDQLFDRATLEQCSLYELLQRPPINLVLHRGVEVIRSVLADDEQAALLACARGDPVLAIERLTYGPDERPIESTSLCFDGSRYAYWSKLSRP